MASSSSPAAALFSIPIAAAAGGAPAGGAIECTEPQPGVFVLTWAAPPDNRLTTGFCTALLAALDAVELGPAAARRPAGSVVVTTSAIAKFYSNGLDLAHAMATDGFWLLLYQLSRRFLTYPMPTIALLNGLTYAGGLMLAMAHDYRIAPAERGHLCLNELLFGAPLKPAMAALFRHKLPPATCRALALEARRFAGPDALAAGIVDAVATAAPGLDDALALVRDRALLDKAKAGVYGVIKTELHSPLLAYLDAQGLEAEDARFDRDQRAEAERIEFAKVWHDQWLAESKSKL